MTTTKAPFDSATGFLPINDPLTALSEPFIDWEQTAQQLPKWLLSDHLRYQLEQLPPFPVDKLSHPAEFERAMLILSFLGHAYVWGANSPSAHLPARLAVPWYQVARQLNRPPVLSYASYALYNWRRLDRMRPVELGNIALLQNFWGGVDEEWFILIHIDIEARAKPAIAALRPALAAVANNNTEQLLHNLTCIQLALQEIYKTLQRMPEFCSPLIYYQRVRPFIHGWNNNPSLPDGLYYEGVDAYQNKAQQFRGETGAQSTIIPALDTLLGIEHEDDPLKAYLLEMRNYMPTQHRNLLTQLAAGPRLRDFILKQRHTNAALVDAYNGCVLGVERFRALHLQYADQYIHQQSQSGDANPTNIGTGGTPFMRYLDKHKRESKQFLIGQ